MKNSFKNITLQEPNDEDGFHAKQEVLTVCQEKDFQRPDMEGGIFTSELNKHFIEELHKGTSPCSKTKSNHKFPLSVYTIFHSIILDIFPWTISFTQPEPSNTTSLKVSLSLPLTFNGLEIPNYKEITFLLPTKFEIFLPKLWPFLFENFGE
jgi:hypothetical protein